MRLVFFNQKKRSLMGSWQHSCSVSGLYITPGTKVKILIMVSPYTTGYYPASQGFGADQNLKPIVPPISAIYDDYGHFAEMNNPDYGLMTLEEMIRVVASRVVTNAQPYNPGDKKPQDREPPFKGTESLGVIVNDLVREEADYCYLTRELYWDMGDARDQSIKRFPLRVVVVLQDVWDILLKTDPSFYVGNFDFDDVKEYISKYMASDLAPHHPKTILDSPQGGTRKHLWFGHMFDIESRNRMMETIIEVFLFGRGNEGFGPHDLHLSDEPAIVKNYETKQDINYIHDFVRMYLERKAFFDGGDFFTEEDGQKMKSYFTDWAEYRYAGVIMGHLRKVWVTACGAGSQHYNHKEILNFNSSISKIAARRLIIDKVNRFDFDLSEEDFENLNDHIDQVLKEDPDFLNDKLTSYGQQLLGPTEEVRITLSQEIVVRPANVGKYSDGTSEALIELRARGVDLTSITNIVSSGSDD